LKNLIGILLTLLLVTRVAVVKAQDPNEKGNLPNYYNEKLHFGFTLGINRTNFIIHPVDHFERFDTLKGVVSYPKLGFNLGIVSELRLHKYLTLRFVPNLSFAERNLQYDYTAPRFDTAHVLVEMTDYSKVKSIESTFLNFPIDLKLRSTRVKNFAAYVLVGAGYSLDLASKRKTKNSNDPNEQIVKLQRDDYSYEVGAGAEFFLQYFKFAIEGKMTLGTKNLIIKDNTIYSDAVDKLNSKIFLISLTFEG